MKPGASRHSGGGPLNVPLIMTFTAAVLIVAGCLAYALTPASFDPARVTWSELEYKASKLGFSTTSRISLEMVPSKQAEASFLPTGNGVGLSSLGPEVCKLRISSSVMGRHSTSDLWFDPLHAVAYQALQITTGSRQRYRAYRFADRYVHSFLRKPEKDESSLPPDHWSNMNDQRYPHPSWAGKQLVVSSASALFYILTTADLSEVGNHVEIPVFSRTNVSLMKIRVEGQERLKANYVVESTVTGKRRVKGRVDALRLSLRAQPLDGTSESNFRLIGLQGDVEIHLDPRNRVPLQIEGRIPRAGRVRIRLQRLTLK